MCTAILATSAMISYDGFLATWCQGVLRDRAPAHCTHVDFNCFQIKLSWHLVGRQNKCFREATPLWSRSSNQGWCNDSVSVKSMFCRETHEVVSFDKLSRLLLAFRLGEQHFNTLTFTYRCIQNDVPISYAWILFSHVPCLCSKSKLFLQHARFCHLEIQPLSMSLAVFPGSVKLSGMENGSLNLIFWDYF